LLLPNNTWTLGNDSTWTSKLTQGDYTVTVYLSGNDGNITDIEVTVPMVSTMPLKVVAAISLALILLSSPIPSWQYFRYN
jgi:hypothetical protein